MFIRWSPQVLALSGLGSVRVGDIVPAPADGKDKRRQAATTSASATAKAAPTTPDGTPTIPAALEIVARIARDYPQAMFFPFRVATADANLALPRNGDDDDGALASSSSSLDNDGSNGHNNNNNNNDGDDSMQGTMLPPPSRGKGRGTTADASSSRAMEIDGGAPTTADTSAAYIAAEAHRLRQLIHNDHLELIAQSMELLTNPELLIKDLLQAGHRLAASGDAAGAHATLVAVAGLLPIEAEAAAAAASSSSSSRRASSAAAAASNVMPPGMTPCRWLYACRAWKDKQMAPLLRECLPRVVRTVIDGGDGDNDTEMVGGDDNDDVDDDNDDDAGGGVGGGDDGNNGSDDDGDGDEASGERLPLTLACDIRAVDTGALPSARVLERRIIQLYTCVRASAVSSGVGGRIALADMAPALAAYDAGIGGGTVEVPGAYMLCDGGGGGGGRTTAPERPPEPHLRPTIRSFGPVLNVMNSLRKPKVLTIHTALGSVTSGGGGGGGGGHGQGGERGDRGGAGRGQSARFGSAGGGGADAATNAARSLVPSLSSTTSSSAPMLRGSYSTGGAVQFLCKGGEDLRQDERVEQLFSVFNGALARDARCAARGMRIRTYSVVPLSVTCGLIQWVAGAKPLLSLLKEWRPRGGIETQRAFGGF
jgi:hypothetical protein